MDALSDPAFHAIILLSLCVTGSAVVLAACLGAPLGAWLAVARFPGREVLIAGCNALMGVPPVVVGLLVYLALSRAGPLGSLGWLFTPTAMVMAQTLLITPILIALTREVIETAWQPLHEPLLCLGATRWQAACALLWDCRFGLLTALLAGLARAAAEVGAVMIVGGNIEGATRVLTTSIALETSKGALSSALVLGAVLLSVMLVINLLAHGLRGWCLRRYG